MYQSINQGFICDVCGLAHPPCLLLQLLACLRPQQELRVLLLLLLLLLAAHLLLSVRLLEPATTQTGQDKCLACMLDTVRAGISTRRVRVLNQRVVLQARLDIIWQQPEE
jgi:hypothetical protein